MDFQKALSYYSREDIQKAMLKVCEKREVVGVFENGAYSKRPNILLYNADILTMVKSGVIEFHGSLEHWSNPILLKEGNYNELRVGWDIVLDLDCDLFEHGKIAAVVLSRALKKYGVNNFSIKFTGGTGFHLGISWKSMPKEIDYRPTANLFPDLARKVAAFLKFKVKDELEECLLKKFSPEELAIQTNKPLGKIMPDDGINPFEIVDIDPILLSQRHLFRLPYSINRNSLRVSLPLKPEDLESFKPEDSVPEKIKPVLGFLDCGEDGEADLLIAEALDFSNRLAKKEEIKKERPRVEILDAIKESYFPPCVKNISNGLTDGRKRALFILTNFLRSAKWRWEDIEAYIIGWNNKNSPPLPDSYIRSQARWHSNRDKKILPPNCPSEKSQGWYESIGVCKPDKICGQPKILIKNPITYPIKILSSYKPKAPKRKLPKKKFEKGDSWDRKENL